MLRFFYATMNFLIVVSAFVAALAGCSAPSNSGERIPLMQGKVFACNAQERVVHPAPKTAIDSYGAALNEYEGVQLPLYRMIESPSGTVYVSVVMAEPNVDPVQTVVAAHRDSVLDVAADSAGRYILLQRHGRWFSVAFPNVLRDPRIAMAYASADSTSVREWHTTREAIRRIEAE